MARIARLAAFVAAGIVLVSTPATAPAADAPGYSHNAAFTEVTGQLKWSRIEGGFWMIQYIDPANKAAAGADAHRGRFVLGKPKELAGFNDGDWVRLAGQISENQASDWQAGTIFDVKTVQRVAAPSAPQSNPWHNVLAGTADYTDAVSEERELSGELIIRVAGRAGRKTVTWSLATETGKVPLNIGSNDAVMRPFIGKQIDVAGKAEAGGRTVKVGRVRLSSPPPTTTQPAAEWVLMAGEDRNYKQLKSEEQVLRGRVVDTATRVTAFAPVLENEAGRMRLIGAQPLKLRDYVGKEVEIKGRRQVLKLATGDAEAFWVGWIRETVEPAAAPAPAPAPAPKPKTPAPQPTEEPTEDHAP